jgi:hypothetical protein
MFEFMKKIILLASMIFSLSQMRSQANITWSIKEKIDKQYFKETKVFSGTYTGFKNEEEVQSFIQKMKEFQGVESCELLKRDKNTLTIKFTMRETHIGRYYFGRFAEDLQIGNIIINQVKKKSADWIPEMGI